MPVITLYKDRLMSLVGGKESFERLVKRLPNLGLHLEEVGKDSVRVEYDPNRLDYSTDYGVARSLKGILGIAKGAPRHDLKSSDIVFSVDPSVRRVRPYIAGLLARGLTLDDETIRQIISMQEDLHNGLGRKRAKLAIGIHDAAAVRPPLRYSTVPPSFAFTPLDSTSPMTIAEILTELPTGKKYTSLVPGKGGYPLIADSRGTVLSFPPVINGNATKVTPRTTDLLIDVTGTDRRVLQDCLSLLAEVFWDAGGSVYSVRIREEGKSFTSPSLEPFEFSITARQMSDRLGLELDNKEIVDGLRRCRLDASVKSGGVSVSVPRYRFDILHNVDLAEEVMYGYGFERMKPSLDFIYTKGSLSARTQLMEAVRMSAVGLGLQEVMGYSMTSEDVLFGKLGRKPDTRLRVAASKSSLYEYLRDALAPTLLQLLADNIHEQYPQRIFEVAEVFGVAAGTETGVSEEIHLGCAITDNASSFTEAKSVLDTLLLRTFNAKPAYQPVDDPLFIDGRVAECMFSGKSLGRVGEVAPRIILSYGLRNPVSLFEISLSPFLKRFAKRERV